ncbi:hypothetical protein QBC35DRAFT_371068 [Podospora australis]|uniref:PH domain-containing protein n=1 Tax=Podospora australis TaxID=1536484 RepID=A0AAN6X6I8_9PEZI|nr:hypothetical protein QBC35DRAFT_371068 [Podospora australis]
MSDSQDLASPGAGLEQLQEQNAHQKRIRPPILNIERDKSERVPLRAEAGDKLSRRGSRMGLRSIFGRNKGTATDGEKSPASPRESLHRPGGLRASLSAGISNWPYTHGHRSEVTLPSFTKPSPREQNLKHKKSHSGVRGQTPPESVSNWTPPPLFQAYPQAIKHAHLPACTASTESILRLNHKNNLGIGGSSNPVSPSVERFDEASGENGEKPKRRHRRNASTTPKFEWTSKVFVLVAAGYLLRYAGEGAYDRLPERILHLGKDSAAFASDAIPGRHWVLQISSVADADGPNSHSTSLLSRLPFRGHERGRASTFLMVFESAEEMDSWITIIRREIEALGGRKVLSETGKPKAEDEDSQLKSQTSQRTLVVRDPERFSRILSPDWNQDNGLSSPDDHLEEDVREQSFDDTSSASVISHEGRQLDALRDSTHRFSYVSSGQRTMITSAGSSPACSPTRDTFIEHEALTPDVTQLDEQWQPRLRPNASEINDRRQSLQAANRMFELQVGSAQSMRPHSTEMVGSQTAPNFSVPHGISKRFSLPKTSPADGVSTPSFSGRMSMRRPPPSAIAINPRPLSLVIDQPSPASSPLSRARTGTESIRSALSSPSHTPSASLSSTKQIELEENDSSSRSHPTIPEDPPQIRLQPPPRPRRPSASSILSYEEMSGPSQLDALLSPTYGIPRCVSSLGSYGGSYRGPSAGMQDQRARRSSFSCQPVSPSTLIPRQLSLRPLKSMARSTHHLRGESFNRPGLLTSRSLSQLAEGPPPAPPPNRALPPIPQKAAVAPPPGFI